MTQKQSQVSEFGEMTRVVEFDPMSDIDELAEALGGQVLKLGVAQGNLGQGA
ncbi:hypothetical protein M3D15_06900 [Pseudoclavibacter alba]|uniref:Uncharacterized protein n=1 Tax=Pseudoclavibacter albus TaxID=272241 RepID=A0ABT2HXM5_9MICO|nr:hypothetical protein [Pseudoclavibacter alba]MCT2043059.1 hypothetical protein [Pseudoclavibacter alba]